jgi:WXG100 family type VII secretion target
MAYDGEGQYLDLTQMDTHQQALETHAQQLRQILDTLSTQIQPLLNSWTGDAKDQYVRAQTAWNQTADEMVAALQKSAVSLADITAMARQTENSMASLWNR